MTFDNAIVNMRKSLLLVITIVTCVMIVSSCKSESEKATAYTDRISRYMADDNVDSLNVIRHELAQEDGDIPRAVVEAMSDSPVNVRGMALALALDVDNLADYLIKDTSDSLLIAVCDSYRMISADDDFVRLCETLQKNLDNMDINDKASYLTSTLSPEQIARGLQPQDSLLLNRIRIIYKSRPDFAARLEKAIKQ